MSTTGRTPEPGSAERAGKFRFWQAFLSAFLLLIAVLACTEPATPTPTPGSAAATPVAGLPQKPLGAPLPFPLSPPPDANLYEITQRLRLKSQESVPRVVNPQSVTFEEGHRQQFWVTDLITFNRFQVTATLKLRSAHAYWYVDDTIEVPQEDLARSAQEFEDRIYPAVTKYFGTEWLPGVDNDPRLAILNTSFPGAAGYFSSADEYPRVVHPYSNEREIIYINTKALKPGTSAYHSTLAHELQHAVHWRADPNEESWVNEGLSVLAEELAGYPSQIARLFTSRPDVQLTHWEEDPQRNGPHYAAAYLFMKYLTQHYGGLEALRRLLEESADGALGIDRYLERQGYKATFEEVFRDWVVANALGGDAPQDSPYRSAAPPVAVERTIVDSAEFSGRVHQYAADYFTLRLPGGDATVTFAGSPAVKLVPNEAHSGRYQWWSHRGDAIDTTLTRAFDLSGLQRVTLTYWLWYDLEEGWDYAYVEVSADGGKTWTVLSGQHTTTKDPVGNSFGPGYTGKSGSTGLTTSGGGPTPMWVEERIDLTPYVGGKVLVRFEYITDEAVNNAGFAIDDISIQELGYTDDAEAERGWEAHGFLRIPNAIPQRFLVQVIEHGKELRVRQMPLDPEQRGELRIQGFGKEVEHATLVVAALAPLTTEEASYHIAVRAEPGR